MKKSTLIIGGVVVGGAAYFLYRFGNKVVSNIDYKFQNVKWVGFKDKQANFSVAFSLTNNNLFPLSIFGFKGILSWRNTPMANLNTAYSDKAPLVLTPKDTKVFTMYFNVSIVDLGADLLKLLMGQRPPAGSNYEGLFVRGNLDGQLKGIRGSIPIEQDLTLSF